MVSIPRFEGSGLDRAKRIVSWVDRTLSHARITPKNVLKLGQQTPLEVLDSGKVMSAFGCLDKAAVIAATLQQNGCEVWIVSERVYSHGKPIGVHFLLEALDGKEKFVVDPHTIKTFFLEGWFSHEHEGKMTTSFKGPKKTVNRKVLRKQVSSNCLRQTTFEMAGIRSRMDYLRLARVTPWRFFRLVASRSSQKFNRRIQTAKSRKLV